MKNFIAKVISGFTVITLIVAIALYIDYQRFLETPLQIGHVEGESLTIKRGMSFKSLANEMVARNWIDNAEYLRFYARLENKAHLIKAGEYRIKAGVNAVSLLDQLIKGETVSYKLTLVEGWSFKQILAAIRNNSFLEHKLNNVAEADIMSVLGFTGQHPEGRFFPDTYAFPRGSSDIEFLRRAYRLMQKNLDEAWALRDQKNIQVMSAEEALILASIIEKETGAAEERPEISGVFTRRLSIGMKLQTDPTVIYGMGKNYHGNIRRKDLVEDTPYNTYVHKGLPPTPICMPGRASINAALHPLEGKTLYFVATGNGRHIFSSTLKAHNAAVRKYQKK